MGVVLLGRRTGRSGGLDALAVRLLAGVLVFACAAAADTASEVADKVLTAVRAGDATALTELAKQPVPDQWYVADELCSRRHYASATAYAEAAKDAPLLRYVKRMQFAGRPDRARHRKFIRVVELIKKGEVRAVLKALESMKPPEDEVSAVIVEELRGYAYLVLDDGPRTAEHVLRAANLAERIGMLQRCFQTLGNRAEDLRHRGYYRETLALRRRNLELLRKHVPGGVAGALLDLGNVYNNLGDYPLALDYYERSYRLSVETGNRGNAGGALNNIGGIHEVLGDDEKALRYFRRGLVIKGEILRERPGHRLHEYATTLADIAMIHARRGDYARAVELLEEHLVLLKKSRGAWEHHLANAQYRLGRVYLRAGDLKKAETHLNNAAEHMDRIKYRPGKIRVTEYLAELRALLGNKPEADRLLSEALELADRIRSADAWSSCMLRRARLWLEQGETKHASAAARKIVERLPAILGGLSDDLAVAARRKWSDAYAVGVRAARANGDLAELCYFSESGRAGALLELLVAREALQAVALPKELRDQEASARRDRTDALRLYRQKLNAGVLAEIASARTVVDRADERWAGVVARIQREAKSAADVLYPHAKELADIQKLLRKGDVFVSYEFLGAASLALVVTRDAADAVDLPPTARVEAACRAYLDAVGRRETDAARLPRLAEDLRKVVLGPLRLPAGVRRLLVSPQGLASYIPFGALLPDVDVAHVPSGSTYGVLLDERHRRGRCVLALGDPEYGTPRADSTVSLLRAGKALARLPATRLEAKSVGTHVLVGSKANEAEFRETLASRTRWRAVHLACHGRLDSERPRLSSLAVTPAGDDDGFLTVNEIFRMKVPADLVVLSACETGKGKVYRAEGIVGFTRAFMFAGAPRVLVSLWKVDDEATRALMTKFYELWNPKDEAQALATATALRKAQAFVRSHEKWRRPFFWAAWQLWGLPD